MRTSRRTQFHRRLDSGKVCLPGTCRDRVPDARCLRHLSNLIHKARAINPVLTGKAIEACTAERMGVVSRVVLAENLLEETSLRPGRIAALSPGEIEVARNLVNEVYEHPT